MDGVSADRAPATPQQNGGGARARALSRALVDFLLPPQCAACGARIDAHGHVCGTCWRALRFIAPPFCQRLGIPFAIDPGFPAVSARAAGDPPAYDRARAVALFDDVSRAMIHALKYRDRHDLARMMGGLMARAGAELLADATLIVPVPLHRGRLWSRRFNQSVLLARIVAEAAGLRFAPDALIRTRPTAHQVGLTAEQRRRNVAGAFAVRTDWAGRLKGQRILLIDDVLTTGATVEACARVARRAGAERVDALVFARVAQIIEAPI
jgi:ComF family protein